jgi:hypothetical protein
MKVWEHIKNLSYRPKNKSGWNGIPDNWWPLEWEEEPLLTKDEYNKYTKIKKIYELFNNTENVIENILESACPILKYSFELTYIPRDQKTYKNYGSPNLLSSCVSDIDITISPLG